MTTHQLIYRSQFREMPGKEQLAHLLWQARRNNHRLLITGMLLYAEGQVLQVLEGNEQAVREVFAAISRDPRHHQLLTLADAEVPRRQFPDWSMGFAVADPAAFDTITGYVNPQKPLFPLPRAHNASPALMQLLLNFVAHHPAVA